MNSAPNKIGINDCRIRVASVDDTEKLLEIYTPYVEKTAITFEYEIPTLSQFENRISRILEKYPYLVAERDGELVGYAYAGIFKERAAYNWAVETTVYVREDQKRTGIGRRMYEMLEKILSMQNVLNLNACIAYTEMEDEYLTHDSIRFHERMGYKIVGRFHKCGNKFGKWYDMIWMEKFLGEHEENPEEIRTFSEIRDEFEEKLGLK